MLNMGIIIGERYEVVGCIGSGGMADVYKAKDHKLNRFVAMKVLKPEFSADTNSVSYTHLIMVLLKICKAGERGLPLLLFLCYSKEKDKFYTRL